MLDGAETGSDPRLVDGDRLAIATAVRVFGQGLAVALDFADVGFVFVGVGGDREHDGVGRGGIDIGYAPGLAATGLHQLDGARYLRDAQHADAMLCRLVVHHSCAIIEAGERGLADILSSEFDPAPDVLASVLTCCDMTTSPDGEPVPVGRRLAEIHDRYGPGHLVSRSIQRATPMILYAVEQVHQRAAQIK